MTERTDEQFARRMYGAFSAGCLALIVVLVTAAACGPKPTTAIAETQRSQPFFRVLVYENVANMRGLSATVLLFEDEVGTCYLQSGVDGGVVVAPQASCAAAKVQSSSRPVTADIMCWDGQAWRRCDVPKTPSAPTDLEAR